MSQVGSGREQRARRWPTWQRSVFWPIGPYVAVEVLSEQLQTALSSRVIIEQAKGVLAQRGGLSIATRAARTRHS